jgi:hypothetical protein
MNQKNYSSTDIAEKTLSLVITHSDGEECDHCTNILKRVSKMLEDLE